MVLKICDIHTYYGESYVLQGISLEVEKGSIIGILGRNGMGKTTLIGSIIGFNPPRRGQILFKGVDIANMPSYKIARMNMGLVPQGRRIFPSLSVKENLLVGARSKGVNGWDEEKIYSLFPVLYERQQHKGNQLSGGEQQMLAIARGLMSSPKLMLLDEPSLGLAPLMVEEIFRIIKGINNEGVTILLVEQNANMALQTAQYGYVMETGTVALHDKAENLIQNDYVRRVYLGAGE